GFAKRQRGGGGGSAAPVVSPARPPVAPGPRPAAGDLGDVGAGGGRRRAARQEAPPSGDVPAPLPFRWDDLDAYISSLQYSATLRHRHQRGLDAPSRLAPAPAAVSAAPPATGQDGAHPMRALEKSSRPVHADVPVPIPPVVSEPPIAAAGDV
ncbi:unnamed protein product, partial [Urochloa humidicola]